MKQRREWERGWVGKSKIGGRKGKICSNGGIRELTHEIFQIAMGNILPHKMMMSKSNIRICVLKRRCSSNSPPKQMRYQNHSSNVLGISTHVVYLQLSSHRSLRQPLSPPRSSFGLVILCMTSFPPHSGPRDEFKHTLNSSWDDSQLYLPYSQVKLWSLCDKEFSSNNTIWFPLITCTSFAHLYSHLFTFRRPIPLM